MRNSYNSISSIKGKVMQIEKALIKGRLHISNVSRKFSISTIYNFAVIYQFRKKQPTFNSF